MVRKLITYFFVLFLVITSTINATNWYVDNENTSGNYDGRSWATAWTNMDSVWMNSQGVNWYAIGDGDTIYISGGATEKIYGPQLANAGALNEDMDGIVFDEQIVICPSWEANHNGDVIFRNTDNHRNTNFTFNKIANAKLTGLNFEQVPTYDAGFTSATAFAIGYTSNVVVDNCRMTSNGTGAAFGFGVCEDITLQNSIVETLPNTYAAAADVFVWYITKGGHTIRNNRISNMSNYEGIYGAAGGEVSTTETSLTDTRLNMVTDYHAGATIHIGTGWEDYYMYVEHNNATTFYGTYVGDYGWTDGVDSKSGFSCIVTDNSLTNSGLSLVENAHIGEMITVKNGMYDASRMIVTSNSTTTFYGTWVEGGTPNNGQAWTCRVTGINPADGTRWWVNTTGHKDMIQFSQYYFPYNCDTTTTTIFDKNFIYALVPNSTAWNNAIYSSTAPNPYNQRFVFTNNLMVVDVPYNTNLDPTLTGSITGITCNSYYKWFAHLSFTFLNNTFIVPSAPVFLTCVDTIIAKNNIFVSTSTEIPNVQMMTIGVDQGVPSDTTLSWKFGLGTEADQDFEYVYKDLDYNLYVAPNWADKTWRAGSGTAYVYDWGEWKALAGTLGFTASGSDVHSDTAWTSIANVRDSVIASYMPTEQLQGTDLSAYGITDDILGNPRTVWTIGALEATDNNIKIFGIESISKINGLIIPSKICGKDYNIYENWYDTHNIWYVDRDATGNDTGRDWENAWTWFDSLGYSNTHTGINWNIIQPGDSIYISGGDDSTVYRPRSLLADAYGNEIGGIIYGSHVTFASGNPVVIAPAWQTRHNGDVYFMGNPNFNELHPIMSVNSLSNLKFVGFNFYDDQGEGILSVGNDNYLLSDSLVTFENCNFISTGLAGLVGANSWKLTFRNCRFETLTNSYANDQDLFTGTCRGYITVDHCQFFYRNDYSSLSGGNSTAINDTMLSDNTLNMVTNYHFNNNVASNGWYLQITSNTDTAFYGSAGWVFASPTPSNGNGVIYGDTTSSDPFFDGGGGPGYFVGSYLIADSTDTLFITYYNNGTFGGTAGWYPNTPENGTPYRMVAGDLPSVGQPWLMGGAHRDVIQLSSLGYNDSVITNINTFSNNLIYVDGAQGTGWNNIIYHYYPKHSLIRYYNNIIVSKNISPGLMSTYSGYDRNRFEFLNNTIIMKGIGAAFVNSLDSIIFKNNLVICDTTQPYLYSTSGASYRDIDFNIYASETDIGGMSAFAYTGYTSDYEGWLSLGFDAHSDTLINNAVTFVDKYGEDIADYLTTTGRDKGGDIVGEYPFLATDILGNTRSGYGIDVGALEYQFGFYTDTTGYFANCFTLQNNLPTSTVVISDSVIVTDLDSAYIVHSGTAKAFEHRIGINGSWSTIQVRVHDNDTIWVRDTTSAISSTKLTARINVGVTACEFNFTTAGVDMPSEHLIAYYSIDTLNNGSVLNFPERVAGNNLVVGSAPTMTDTGLVFTGTEELNIGTSSTLELGSATTIVIIMQIDSAANAGDGRYIFNLYDDDSQVAGLNYGAGRLTVGNYVGASGDYYLYPIKNKMSCIIISMPATNESVYYDGVLQTQVSDYLYSPISSEGIALGGYPGETTPYAVKMTFIGAFVYDIAIGEETSPSIDDIMNADIIKNNIE